MSRDIYSEHEAHTKSGKNRETQEE